MVTSEVQGQAGMSAYVSDSRSITSMSRCIYNRAQEKYSYNITQAKAEGPGLNLNGANEQGMLTEASGEAHQG